MAPGSLQKASRDSTHLSDQLNHNKLLQYKVLSSSTDFALDLDPTLCCKTQDISCRRGDRLASHKKLHSLSGNQQHCFWEGFPCRQGDALCSNISLFHMAPLLLPHPSWAWEDDRCFGEADNHPFEPHVAFLLFSAYCLPVTVSYLAFSTG